MYTIIHFSLLTAENQKLLEKIQQQCDQIQDNLNNQFYENLQQGMSEGSNLLAVITTVRHIWQRLRVWLPKQNEPEIHPDAPPPILPVLLF
ncbi:MAG: hypothetical protein VKJ02_00005 [Snowella sp.]|nr:hypothetical protein [Snowella sp.]